MGQGIAAGSIAVGAGYFAALGIQLRSGRDFAAADSADSPPVAVISEPTVGGQAIGPWRRVEGVAADVRQSYGDRELSDIYVPYSRRAATRRSP